MTVMIIDVVVAFHSRLSRLSSNVQGCSSAHAPN